MPEEAAIMTEHTEQAPTQPGAVPARIQLDDFIEAVTRGVTRALAAQEDVSGYLGVGVDPANRPPTTPAIRPPLNVLIGFVPFPFPPPTFPDLSGGQDSTAQRY